MRVFVLGNGESLNVTPLDDLIGEHTIAVNRIHLLYNQTKWRPEYYFRTEPPGGGDPQAFYDECRLHIQLGEKCIFPRDWKEVLGEHENIEYVSVCRHFKYPPPHKKAHLQWHLPLICDTSVITAAIQAAVLKGFDEIYLLGCDLSGGHFSDKDNGLIQADLWKLQHEIAKACSPVKIYNATIGGNLEVYERVNLWEKNRLRLSHETTRLGDKD